MLLSTNTVDVLRHYSAKEGVDIFRDAGFQAMDFSFFDEEWCREELPDSFFTELGQYARDAGMCFNQTHAPFHSSYPDPEQTANRFRQILRSIRRAALLGAEVIVVHPVQHLHYADPGAPEQLFEMNMQFYGKLIPYCEEYGIRIGVENMWQYHPWPKINHSTCSTPQEMNRYVDSLNSPWITGCLDVGHTSLVGQAPDEFVLEMGANRLGALHLHDVTKTEDSHTIPHQGVIDWKKLMQALKTIGYRGDITFECDGFLKKVPPQLLPDALRLLAHTGHMLLSQLQA